MHVTPVFNRRTPTKITGYTGRLSTTLSVSDFEALPPLLVALTEMPDVSVDGPWWSLRRDNPMYREVRLAAIADARRRATDYAAAFGAQIADLVEISDLESGFAGGAREMRSFAMAKGRRRRTGLPARAGDPDRFRPSHRALHPDRSFL